MRTAAYKVDVASDRRRRENVPRHNLCFLFRKLLSCRVKKGICFKKGFYIVYNNLRKYLYHTIGESYIMNFKQNEKDEETVYE